MALDVMLCLFIVNLTLQPLVEPDFGWHLRAGLDLIDHGWSLPVTDPYSHTMPDWHWVEHAWLTDGLLALIYRGLGPYGALGVILFFGIVTTTALWIAASLALVRRSARLLAIVGALWVALPYLGARTQLISVLGVAIVLWILNQITAFRTATAWTLPPLFLLWSNLHGGFTAGLFVVAVVMAGHAGLRFLVDRGLVTAGRIAEPLLGWGDLARVAAAFCVSAVATLANPYGWQLHAEIYASLTDRFMLENLVEWRPVSFQGWAGRAYLMYLIGITVLIAGWYRRVEPIRRMLLALFFVLSLFHWRNVTLFLMVSIPLVAQLLEGAGRWAVERLSTAAAVAKAAITSMTVGAALLLVHLGPDHLVHIWNAGTMPETFFEQTEYPIEAVRWIRAHPQEAGDRLYNDYGYGGFLDWWLPEHKVFIDGRMPAWRLGDRWIFSDYLRLNRPDSEALAILNRYGVDWALVNKDSPLAEMLAREPGWHLLYGDAKVDLFRRDG